MKEQIYTIPVNDAFSQLEICPLCELRKNRTQQLVEYYLGPSLMEPDNRVETNKKGFCKEHMTNLYNSQENRLGFALMLHTHMLNQRKQLEYLLQKNESKDKQSNFNFSKLFAKSTSTENVNISDSLNSQLQQCALCDRLDDTMEHYYDVIFYQYSNDDKFKIKINKIPGFCLDHVASLIEKSKKYLNKNKRASFNKDLKDLELLNYDKLVEELEWFTMKFDYKNKDKPWKNSRTAIPRTINFLNGLGYLDRDINNDK